MTTPEMRLPASLGYVAFASLHDAPLTIAARMRVPAQGQRLPAVILLHGSAGPSAREGGYATALNAAGFVTLEPDQWSARGLAGGAAGRPKTAAETLPDLYGVRAFLARHPRVDPARIGVMGFSFGGVAAMLAAMHRYNDVFLPDAAFPAIMPFYPATWIFNRVPGFELDGLVATRILLVTAELDQYDNDPQVSRKLLDTLAPEDRQRIELEVVPEAHHGFDIPGADVEVDDPFGNQGQGGRVIIRGDRRAMEAMHRRAVAFFREALMPS
ncbi:MAG TPA: dienelactone hydrolase family protein [Gammaproteobacteria bacterium]|nr:dienelactone hydrolase family protein [Gammaproteobacteria bacterium]